MYPQQIPGTSSHGVPRRRGPNNGPRYLRKSQLPEGQIYGQSSSAVVSFVGRRVILANKVLGAVSSFVGSYIRMTTVAIFGMLTLTGMILTAIVMGLIGIVAFTGNTLITLHRALSTATLIFAPHLGVGRQFLVVFNGILELATPFARFITHPRVAILTLSGTTPHMTRRAWNALVSGIATLQKLPLKNITGILMFHGGITKTLGRGLMALWSGMGILRRQAMISLEAVSSFITSMRRTVTKVLRGIVFFSVGLISPQSQISFDAALKFTNIYVRSIRHSLTSNLSFTERLSKFLTRKLVVSVLTFVGKYEFMRIHFLVGTLHVTGKVSRATKAVLFNGMLAPTSASLSKYVYHNVQASMEFIGSITKSVAIHLASLVILGATVGRQTLQTLQGVLLQSGHLTKGFFLVGLLRLTSNPYLRTVEKGLVATLGFLTRLKYPFRLVKALTITVIPTIKSLFVRDYFIDIAEPTYDVVPTTVQRPPEPASDVLVEELGNEEEALYQAVPGPG